MPLIYVHGIGNRWGPAYVDTGWHRNTLFRKFLLPVIGSLDPVREPIPSPLWGDDSARLFWGGASLRAGKEQLLGPSDLAAHVLAEAAVTEGLDDPERVLCTVARRDLADAVDLLFSVAPPDSQEEADAAAEIAEQVAAYIAAMRAMYPKDQEAARHPWLDGVQDDGDFIDELFRHSSGWGFDADGGPRFVAPAPGAQVLGAEGEGKRWVRGASQLVRTLFVGLPSRAAISGLRGLAAARQGDLVARFAGDVLAYLGGRHDDGDVREQIVQTVAAPFDDLRSNGSTGPLVVVAHSMGGNIVYDMLSFYRQDLEVDLFVTVGSQVGMFEELKLFRASDRAVPGGGRDRVAPPWGIKRWLNIYDPADPLGHRAAPVFEEVVDLRYPTDAAWAHSAYLRQPHFHLRLAAAVRKALL